jgi:hypothetical protein
MNRCIITLGALAALCSFVRAQTDDVIVDGRIITAAADFDGDGADDIVITDPSTGQFTVGFGGSHPDFAWWPSAKPLPTGGVDGSLINFTGLEVAGGFNAFGNFQGGVRVAVGDVNGDGTSDYILTSVQHPAIYVFHGSTSRVNALTNFERHPLGAGPSGVALAHLDTSTPGPELAVPLLAELAPRTVEVRPQRNWAVGGAGLDVLIGNTGADRFQEFALLAPGTSTNGGRHSGHLGAYVFKNDTGSRLRIARFSSTSPPRNIQHPEPWTHVLAADMRGANGPGQFVLWGEGLDSLKIVTVQAAAGDDLPTEEVSFYYNRIAFVYAATRSGSQNIAVGHSDGTRISIIAWNSATNRFNEIQNLIAPPERRFTKAAGVRNGLLAVLDDGTFLKHEFNASGQLVPAGGGALPAMPAAGGHATVMLYTDDPLGGKAFEFESFLTGAWARDAAFAGGQISAVSEIFQSTALGLGDPENVVLTPSANPGAAAQAQGNQFGDASSSIFFAGGAGADGNAAVQISPQSGSYGAVIQVKFTPAVAGTSVVYRVNGQAWQQAGAGGFFLAADAVVEYYGQSAGGALSTIHSANYDITPQFAADANGDGLPDALAASLGLDPGGDGDTDDDGVGDANELLNGGDPRNANSQPAALNVTLPPSLEISLSVQTPSENGPGDSASRWMRVSMLTTGGTMVREDLEMENGGGSFTVNAGLLPTARAGEPGLSDFERALIAEVELAGTDPEARGASLFGMAFAPGFVLPQQPADEIPSLTQWIANTTAAVGGASGGIWKTTNFLTADTGPMLINADTTLAVAAFSAWTAQRLDEAGVADANFAWDHRGSRGDMPAQERARVRQQIKTFQCPSDSTTPAWDLGAVARSFYSAIATGATYEPLRIAAREMIRRDNDPDRPIVLGRIHNAAQALLHFFDTGELESFYAASITQPMAVLTALRAQLLGLPEPRAVREGVGILRSLDGGRTWVVETAGGEIIALLDDRRIATAGAGGLTLQRLPAQPSDTGGNTIYVGSANGGVWRNTVRVFGFILPAAEPRPPGTSSAIELLSLTLLDVDLRGDLYDTDGDRLDDAFEMKHFNTLAHTFDDDTDDDGYTNGEEYFLLGNPALAAMMPAGPPAIPHNIASIPGEDAFTLAWDGRDEVRYSVQETTDLGDWANSPVAPRETAPGRYEWTHPDPGARRFVRIVTEFEK